MESVELSMAFFCMFCSPRWSPFSTHATCWCSMHRVKTLFFDSPIYLLLHEQSNWHTPVWLFGSRLGLFFWQRICCRFFPDVKAISFLIFFNSRFTFGLMFGIQGNFRDCSYFSCCILLLSFSKVACCGHSQRTYRLNNFLLLWYISLNISSVLCEGIHLNTLWIHFWWC